MILDSTICDPVQALEYLLWASISLELSIPLMIAKYLPWIVTLYCAVCHCYYDNHAVVQAEVKDTRHLHSDTYKYTVIAMSTDYSQADLISYKYQLSPVVDLSVVFCHPACLQSILC